MYKLNLSLSPITFYEPELPYIRPALSNPWRMPMKRKLSGFIPETMSRTPFGSKLWTSYNLILVHTKCKVTFRALQVDYTHHNMDWGNPG